MGRFGKAVRIAAVGAALALVALPGMSAAAEPGAAKGSHEGHDHGAHGGMKMEGHGGMSVKPGDHDTKKGEKVFAGTAGPWAVEARLVDMKAQMEQSGVSAKTAARFAGKRHLMLFLTDAKTGKPADGVSGKVGVAGPDKASTSKVTLIGMGNHIGADVAMPTPGKYTFKADIEAADRKGSATFSYTLK